MKFIQISIALFLIFLIHGQSYCQDTTIEFRNYQFTLGMTKSEVRTALTQQGCSIKPDTGNTWTAFWRENDFTQSAFFVFNDDRLNAVHLDWNIGTSTSITDFFEKFIGIINHLTPKNGRVATIKTLKNDTSDASIEDISIDFGDKEIDITLSKVYELQGIDMYEVLHRKNSY